MAAEMEQVPENCPGPSTEKAGTGSTCDGCPNQANCQSGAFRDQAQEIAGCLANVGKIILVLSGKGGVGKSTVATQIAWGLASCKKNVGVLDLDICGPSIPRMLGKEKAEVKKTSTGWVPVSILDNLSVISVGYLVDDINAPLIWRGPRLTSLVQTLLTEVDWDDLDYLVIDTPPGTSDIQIALGQLLSLHPATEAVLVTTPQEVALLDVKKGIRFCQQAHINMLGLVENMSGFVCPCCNEVTQIFKPSSGGAAGLCEKYGIDLLAQIPLDPRLGDSCDSGAPISWTTTGPVGDALKDLILKVTGDSDLQFCDLNDEDAMDED